MLQTAPNHRISPALAVKWGVDVANESGPSTPNPDKCLRSWKEIAAYLECSVATAQRWEKFEGLPIHRHVHGTSGSAYAYVSEIETWRKQRTVGAALAAGPTELSPNGSPTGPQQGRHKNVDSASNPASALRFVRSAWPWAVVLVVVLASLSVYFSMSLGTRSGNRLVRFDIDVGMEIPSFPRGPNVLISPDGARIVFSARGPDHVFRLYTRALDSPTAQLLPGTENAAWAFFSPDGKWVGYFAGDQLLKMPIEGGPPVALCNAQSVQVRGASWGSDGFIIAALEPNSGLMRVPENGGPPVQVTDLDRGVGDATHRWPQVLPGSQEVLFTACTTVNRYDEASIEVQSLKTGRRKTLMRGGYYGRFLPSGHLVYAKGTRLFAVAMDAELLELKGDPAAIFDDIVVEPDIGAMGFDFSKTGTALCLTGKWRAWPRSLAWVDETGSVQPMSAAPRPYGDVRVSPDGTSLALSIGTDAAEWYIALYDWKHDRLTRLTFGNADLTPQWFPDGSHIAFASERHGGLHAIYTVRADGGGEPERLTESNHSQIPFSFAQHPTRLAFMELYPRTGWDIWTVPLGSSGDAKGSPVPFLCTQANEELPAFSPDGRWIAYQSNEAGGANSEVYVRSSSHPQIKWQVSVDGGSRPVWSRTGTELYYENQARGIMAVRCVIKEEALSWSKPELRFDGHVAADFNNSRNFDSSPDGRLAVIIANAVDPAPANHLTVLLNFFEELRRRTGR